MVELRSVSRVVFPLRGETDEGKERVRSSDIADERRHSSFAPSYGVRVFCSTSLATSTT